jgi:hypothetical protein
VSTVADNALVKKAQNKTPIIANRLITDCFYQVKALLLKRRTAVAVRTQQVALK